MAEPKAKTLQMKLGFFDEDLKKPEHDDILKWLCIDDNLINMIHSFYSCKKWLAEDIELVRSRVAEIVETSRVKTHKSIENLESDIQRLVELTIPENEKKYSEALEKEIMSGKDNNNYLSSKYYQREIQENKEDLNSKNQLLAKEIKKSNYLNEWRGLPSEIPLPKSIQIVEKKWELPVTSNATSINGYKSATNLIGFIDLQVTFNFWELTVSGIDFYKEDVVSQISWNQSLKRNYKTLLIEVKTKISTLGELFRQINTYRTYLAGDYFVVCPDDTEKEYIESQNIKFYKYPIK